MQSKNLKMRTHVVIIDTDLFPCHLKIWTEMAIDFLPLEDMAVYGIILCPLSSPLGLVIVAFNMDPWSKIKEVKSD